MATETDLELNFEEIRRNIILRFSDKDFRSLREGQLMNLLFGESRTAEQVTLARQVIESMVQEDLLKIKSIKRTNGRHAVMIYVKGGGKRLATELAAETGYGPVTVANGSEEPITELPVAEPALPLEIVVSTESVEYSSWLRARVKITEGAFADYEGDVIEDRDNRLKVQLPLAVIDIDKSAAVNIDRV